MAFSATTIELQDDVLPAKAHLEGSVLHLALPLVSGGMLRGHTDLDSYLANVDGQLTCIDLKPYESILISCSCFMLEGATLKALCIGDDEKLHYSETNLIEYLVNGNQRLLHDLRSHTQIFLPFLIPIIPIIIAPAVDALAANNDAPPGVNAFIKFLENVLGFGAAAFPFLNGDNENALLAVAYCADSTIVCTGVCIGGVLGGPLGAAIRAEIATPIGILAETAITNNWLGNPDLKAQFEEATIGRYVYETARNMLAAGAVAFLAGFVGDVMSPALTGYVAAVMTMYGTEAGVVVSEVVMYQILRRVADALNGDVSVLAEWDNITEQVEGLIGA